jgi:hypothetical protein
VGKPSLSNFEERDFVERVRRRGALARHGRTCSGHPRL